MQLKDIISQLNEAYEGDPWFGNSISTYLQEVTPDMLNNRRGNGHSIGDIINHMIIWRNYVISKLKYEPTEIRMGSQEDWVTRSYNQEDLTILYTKFKNTQKELNQLLTQKDDSLLSEIVPGKDISFQKLLLGIIAHDIYHLGQIYLLRKGN